MSGKDCSEALDKCPKCKKPLYEVDSGLVDAEGGVFRATLPEHLAEYATHKAKMFKCANGHKFSLTVPVAPVQPLSESELDLSEESEQAQLLQEAYQLGFHDVRDGKLKPVLDKLNALIDRREAAAMLRQRAYDERTVVSAARVDELEKLLGSSSSDQLEVAAGIQVMEGVIQARLASLREGGANGK